MVIKLAEKIRFAEYIVRFSFLLYCTDIFLISKLGENSSIRAQDIASILAFAVVFYIVKREERDNISRSGIIVLITVFLVYVIMSNLIFYATGNVDRGFIFYIGKETEFYLCFIITAYYFRNYITGACKLIKVLIAGTCLYGFYQVFTAKISYYGIGTIFEEAPSLAGTIYLTSSILSFYLYERFSKKKFGKYAVMAYILTLFTISKTSIIGLNLFYLIFFTLRVAGYITDKDNNTFQINMDKILVIMSLSIFILVVIISGFHSAKATNLFLENKLILKALERFQRLGSSYSFRSNKAGYYLEFFIGDSWMAILFGCGKGVTEYAFNVDTLAVDNQFARAIIEFGLIGMILWVSVVFLILISLEKSGNKTAFYSGISLFLSYLAMGIGYEVFVVTKAGIVFWFLMGVFISSPDFGDETYQPQADVFCGVGE